MLYSGIGDFKYVVSRDPLLIDHMIWNMCNENFNIKMAFAEYFCHLVVTLQIIRRRLDVRATSWEQPADGVFQRRIVFLLSTPNDVASTAR